MLPFAESSNKGRSRHAEVVFSGSIYASIIDPSKKSIILTIIETKCQSKDKSLVVMPWPVTETSVVERIDKSRPTLEWLSEHTKVGNLFTDAPNSITKLAQVCASVFSS